MLNNELAVKSSMQHAVDSEEVMGMLCLNIAVKKLSHFKPWSFLFSKHGQKTEKTVEAEDANFCSEN